MYKSKRIVVQKGVFTIHGIDRRPLDERPELAGCLKKLIIPYESIDDIKGELNIAGVTESSLFPELSGLAAELRAYWS